MAGKFHECLNYLKLLSLESFQRLKVGIDGLGWNWNSIGAYKVSSGYKFLKVTGVQEQHLAMKTNLESPNTSEGRMLLMVVSKRGSFETWKSKKEVHHLSYTLLFVERQMGEWGICSYIAELLTNYGRFLSILEAYNGQCPSKIVDTF